jgi:GGDEF domain-containing protein
MTTVDSSARAGLLTKRALVVASHAVEQTALTRLGDEPAVVIALFQRLPYFEREREMYAGIARQASATVVGMVDRSRPDLPPGVTPVLLRPDEDLAGEWSVVVLTSKFGASVVARDLDQIEGGELSVESGRVFHGRWGFRREDAYAEVVRLRDGLGDRLPPGVRGQIDAVLRGVTGPPSAEVELRAEAAMRSMAEQLVRRQLDAAWTRFHTERDRRIGRDPLTGLHTLDSLGSWVGLSAAGTLPLGLTLLQVDGLDGIDEDHASRVGLHAENNVADLLRAGLRPVDRAVRVSKTEFLVAQPAVSDDTLYETGERILRGLDAMSEVHPFVELSGRLVRLVTRERPLPLHRMRMALAQQAADDNADDTEDADHLAGRISGMLNLGS